MPGGGASGDVILPSYTIAQHAKWLNNYLPTGNMLGLSGVALTDYDGTFSTNINALTKYNVHDEMVTASTLNPFTGVAAVDPDTYMDDVDDALQEWNDTVADLDPADKLAAAVNAALAAFDDEVDSDTEIDAAVVSFTDRTEAPYQRALSSQLATLLGGRAIMSSGADDTFALMNAQRQAEIADYTARLGLSKFDRRSQMAAEFTRMFISLLQLQQSTSQAYVGVAQEIAKAHIIAKQDQQNIDLGYDENEVRWRLSLFESGAQMISSYTGASPVPRPMTKGERALNTLGNAVTTAIGAGMALGSPGAGIAIGATYLGLGAVSQNWR